MEFKSFAQSEKRKDLDGHTVRDFSFKKHGIEHQRIAVESRCPARGYLNAEGLVMVQVLNHSGYLLQDTLEGETFKEIHNGDILYIEPGEKYAFEGSMSLVCVEIPITSQDTAEFIEYTEPH